MSFDRDMQRALELDGEKLRQLTGEDHGPVFLADDPYPGYAPCPACFESSGYIWNHGVASDGADYAVQTDRLCRECNGSGEVEAEPITLADLEQQSADEADALSTKLQEALDGQG